jgi:hypothetical protein
VSWQLRAAIRTNGCAMRILMLSADMRSAVCAPRVIKHSQPVACVRNLASWQSNQIDCTSRVKHFGSPCCCSYSSSRASKQRWPGQAIPPRHAPWGRMVKGTAVQLVWMSRCMRDDEPLARCACCNVCELSSIWHNHIMAHALSACGVAGGTTWPVHVKGVPHRNMSFEVPNP